MAINKKLIHFKNYSDFIGSSGINGTTMPTNGYYHNIPETSIVFIQDTKQIWTHGQLYSCPFTEEEINQLLVGSNIKLDGYSEIDSPIDILATDTVNQAIGKLEDYINSMSELNAILVDTEDVADDPAVNNYITSTQLENKLLNKQDKLVSGSNIKTINGESILGEGDITIGGDSSSDVYYLDCGTGDSVTEGTIDLSEWDKLVSARIIILRFSFNRHASFLMNGPVMNRFISAVAIRNFDTGGLNYYSIFFEKESDSITWTLDSYTNQMNAYCKNDMSETICTIEPNQFYVWGEVASLDLSFAKEIADVANEYTFQFTSGTTPTSLTLPDTIQWVNGAPSIEANKTYQVSIVNNIGLIVSV